MSLEWDWNGTGMSLEWDWNEPGMGLEWDWNGTTAKQQCQEVCVLPLNLVTIHQFRVRSSSTVQEVHYPEWDLHDKCM